MTNQKFNIYIVDMKPKSVTSSYNYNLVAIQEFCLGSSNFRIYFFHFVGIDACGTDTEVCFKYTLYFITHIHKREVIQVSINSQFVNLINRMPISAGSELGSV